MQPTEPAEGSEHDAEPDLSQASEGHSQPEAIFTCKFPGCTRQYASTDGVRKHCRKSHPDWLREVDLEKAANGCRWAAYCTREEITEGNDPRTTPVGAKRAREIMIAGGMLPPMPVGSAAAVQRSHSYESAAQRPRHEGDGGSHRHGSHHPPRDRHGLGLAMDGKSALRPPLARSAAVCENTLPPEMVSVPADLASPLPVGVSSLTPNAQARWRLGAIADSESLALLGNGTSSPLGLPSPLCDNAPLPHGGGFFVQWALPPLKRGTSLNDTRDAVVVSSSTTTAFSEETTTTTPTQTDEEVSIHQDSPSFLESVLA